MEQEKHGTAEHVEQENGRRKKISVNFMKNRMHIAQKHKIKIVKILKMTKKILTSPAACASQMLDGFLAAHGGTCERTAYYDTGMEQIPQGKVPKRKRCKCGTKSGW